MLPVNMVKRLQKTKNKAKIMHTTLSFPENENESKTSHMCPEGYSIPITLVCDNVPHCTDSSDELGCPEKGKNVFIHYRWSFILRQDFWMIPKINSKILTI